MKTAAESVACVIDKGLFLPIALKLGEQFKKVFYWSPWERDFPTVQNGLVGDGFKQIERVASVWDVSDKCDVFIFPDIGFSGMQLEIVRQGAPVWGARDGDKIECNRGRFLDALKSLGLPVPPHEKIIGLNALRDYLRDKEDKWIKISKWRGDLETFHWRSWEEDENELDKIAVTFGPAKEYVLFFVFDPIETDIEDGVDTYCIDGALPEFCVHGMECKDKSFLATFTEFSKIPDKVRHYTEAFSLLLADFQYRSFFSSEIRIAGEQSFFIDPTCRAGSPPSQVMTEIYSNLGEIMLQGAHGVCLDPQPAAKFGVQARINFKRDKSSWTTAQIPESIRQWVKCGNCCEIDGRLCFPPTECEGFDWLVAVGDTIKGAIDNLKEHAAELPCGAECDISSLGELLQEVDEAEASGMEFTDQPVPEPAVVLDEKHA